MEVRRTRYERKLLSSRSLFLMKEPPFRLQGSTRRFVFLFIIFEKSMEKFAQGWNVCPYGTPKRREKVQIEMKGATQFGLTPSSQRFLFQRWKMGATCQSHRYHCQRPVFVKSLIKASPRKVQWREGPIVTLRRFSWRMEERTICHEGKIFSTRSWIHCRATEEPGG